MTGSVLLSIIVANIEEVAKLAGVSTATVSRTFRTPDLLSQKTRRHVLDVAARLNYQPRQRTANLSREFFTEEVSQAFGFLFFASDQDGSQVSEFYIPMMMAAQAEAGLHGIHLILRTASRFDVPMEMPKMFQEQSVTGMLLVGAALPKVMEAYEPFLPVSVVVDNRDAAGRHDCILSDGFGGISAVTRYLIGLGHRRIAFVQDEPTAPSFRDRQHGYLCALWDAGITPRPEWVVATPRHAVLEPYLKSLLLSEDRPTALVCANDRNAFAALTACRALGLSVPDDISVAGFDNTGASVHSHPPLTTVEVNKEQMGRLAVRQLLARIGKIRSGSVALPATNFVIPVELVKRASCAPPSIDSNRS